MEAGFTAFSTNRRVLLSKVVVLP